MGYEIKYLYHERVDGKYNTEETKELKKKLGSPLDETPLEQLAAAVLAQMARRDILVVDVEIFEFTRKKLNFKQSNDGVHVLIKGKKFALDKSANIVAADQFEEELEEDFEDETPVARANVPAKIKKQVAGNGSENLAPMAPVNQGRTMFWVEYDPNMVQEAELKRKKLKLTKGRRYPVHRTKDTQIDSSTPGNGLLYSISDDAKQVVEIREHFFSVCGQGLVGDDEVGFSNPPPSSGRQPKLMYEGQMHSDPNIPDVRRPREVPENLRHIPIDGQEVGIPAEMFQIPVLRPSMPE